MLPPQNSFHFSSYRCRACRAPMSSKRSRTPHFCAITSPAQPRIEMRRRRCDDAANARPVVSSSSRDPACRTQRASSAAARMAQPECTVRLPEFVSVHCQRNTRGGRSRCAKTVRIFGEPPEKWQTTPAPSRVSGAVSLIMSGRVPALQPQTPRHHHR